jgi:hypothetical protein
VKGTAAVELGERFKGRAGGHTRIVNLGPRDGDNGELHIIELVDDPREREADKSGGRGSWKADRTFAGCCLGDLKAWATKINANKQP